ncbi:hypothetical protein BH09MYX1_BH09MYX1_04040 [soil metagenome]
MDTQSSFDKDKMKAVYTMTERDGRTYWTKVGVGFPNQDGSLTLKLEAFPTNGTLQVREMESAEQRADSLRKRFAAQAAPAA